MDDFMALSHKENTDKSARIQYLVYALRINEIKMLMHNKDCIEPTSFHSATVKLFNAVKLFTNSFVKANHVIACSIAFTPTLFVERNCYIFLVATFISVQVILWTAAFYFIDVTQLLFSSYSNAVQVEAGGAFCPYIETTKRKRQKQASLD